MTLIERARKVRETLCGRYEQLNALWLRAEEELTRLHIPRPVGCDYRQYLDDPHDDNTLICECLGIQKVKGKWRICHATYPAYSAPELCGGWTPITECSVETRVRAASHLPKLREAIVKSAENFVPQVDDAIDELKKALNVPDDHLRALLAERAKLNGRGK